MSLTSGGTAPKGWSAGGNWSASAGSAGIVITFSTAQRSSVAVPQPDRGGQVLDADHHADEAPGLARVVGGPHLEHHLVLVAEVDRAGAACPRTGSRSRGGGRSACRAGPRDSARPRSSTASPTPRSPRRPRSGATRRRRRSTGRRGRSPRRRSPRRCRGRSAPPRRARHRRPAAPRFDMKMPPGPQCTVCGRE